MFGLLVIALPLAAVILPQTRAGVGVTDGKFHGPAVAIHTHEIFRTHGQIGREKGCDGGERFAVAWAFRVRNSHEGALGCTPGVGPAVPWRPSGAMPSRKNPKTIPGRGRRLFLE